MDRYDLNSKQIQYKIKELWLKGLARLNYMGEKIVNLYNFVLDTLYNFNLTRKCESASLHIGINLYI